MNRTHLLEAEANIQRLALRAQLTAFRRQPLPRLGAGIAALLLMRIVVRRSPWVLFALLTVKAISGLSARGHDRP